MRKDGIGVEFKNKDNTGIREGVKFTKGKFTFSGSKIDKQFSYSKLDKHFAQAQKAAQVQAQPNHRWLVATSNNGIMRGLALSMAG